MRSLAGPENENVTIEDAIAAYIVIRLSNKHIFCSDEDRIRQADIFFQLSD